jgi:hypothetical protein
MALDTRDRRASALACALSFLTVLPAPDGLALDQGDRQQVSALYRGVLAIPASVLDICDTSVSSLVPNRTVDDLNPVRSVDSLTPVRTVTEYCP